MVPDGEALQFATKLAVQIAEFPQACMRADRRAVYAAAFGGGDTAMAAALQAEFDAGKVAVLAPNVSSYVTHFVCPGIGVLEGEAVPGARRFAGGEGRGGSFV